MIKEDDHYALIMAKIDPFTHHLCLNGACLDKAMSGLEVYGCGVWLVPETYLSRCFAKLKKL